LDARLDGTFLLLKHQCDAATLQETVEPPLALLPEPLLLPAPVPLVLLPAPLLLLPAPVLLLVPVLVELELHAKAVAAASVRPRTTFHEFMRVSLDEFSAPSELNRRG